MAVVKVYGPAMMTIKSYFSATSWRNNKSCSLFGTKTTHWGIHSKTKKTYLNQPKQKKNKIKQENELTLLFILCVSIPSIVCSHILSPDMKILSITNSYSLSTEIILWWTNCFKMDFSVLKSFPARRLRQTTHVTWQLLALDVCVTFYLLSLFYLLSFISWTRYVAA